METKERRPFLRSRVLCRPSCSANTRPRLPARAARAETQIKAQRRNAGKTAVTKTRSTKWVAFGVRRPSVFQKGNTCAHRRRLQAVHEPFGVTRSPGNNHILALQLRFRMLPLPFCKIVQTRASPAPSPVHPLPCIHAPLRTTRANIKTCSSNQLCLGHL